MLETPDNFYYLLFNNLRLKHKSFIKDNQQERGRINIQIYLIFLILRDYTYNGE
uniref:Uncharacterized protein n=1 Tax=Phlebia radiata TaxID=5308 RepID=L8B971_PHLRA|nr:hypothetical protein PRA_mt0137 [Phlebia radiata]CCE89222.1 hypothetical protein PRA_mt0137 [Phlebia radiata]